MRDVLLLFVHLIVRFARLFRTGGRRSVLAESVLLRHQLLILHRGRKRDPNLYPTDRILACLRLCRRTVSHAAGAVHGVCRSAQRRSPLCDW